MDILDLIIFDLAVDHFTENIQHAHAMVRVGGTTRSHIAGEVACLDRVDGGAANADFAVRVFGVEPAGAHEAVLAAGRVRADGTGFHVCGTVVSGFNPVPASLFDHFLSGFANRQIPDRNQRFVLDFVHWHISSLRGKISLSQFGFCPSDDGRIGLLK